MLAVLIDADNISATNANVILEEINKLGEPALRRVYGDWSSDQLNPWQAKVRQLGLVAMQESANTKGKNASDIGLVIDAMDILHTGRFDGFVLVSSDSDFTALANRIREEGKDVFGIGEAKTPESLRNVCNRFIYIENIVKPPSAPAEGVDDEQAKVPLTKAVPLIIKAMQSIEQDDDWYTLSRIGAAIRADNPDFDPRTYGKSKLGDLVRGLENEFATRKTGSIVHVSRVTKRKGSSK